MLTLRMISLGVVLIGAVAAEIFRRGERGRETEDQSLNHRKGYYASCI